MSYLNKIDELMIGFMDYCVEQNINGIKSRAEFLRSINFNPNGTSALLSGDRSFGKEHLQLAGQLYGLSIDYVFGFSSQMFRQEKKRPPIELLWEAVKAIEKELSEHEAELNDLKPMKKRTKSRGEDEG